MFTKSEKIIIYNLLLEKYPLNSLIYKDDLENYLTENGLDFKQYSYLSYSHLFKDLSEFLKEERKGNKTFYLLKNYTDKTSLTSSNKKDKKQVLTKNIYIKKEKKKLKDADKKIILNLLDKNFKQNNFYLLSIVSQYLENNNIHYSTYGFSKMKLLLSSIKEITIKDKTVNDVPVTYISFKLDDKKEINKKNNIKKEIIKKEKNKKEIPEFKDIYIPNKLLSSLINQIDGKFDEKKIISIIENDYKNNTNNLNSLKDSFTFKLSIKDKENEDILVCIKKSTSKTDYTYFISFIGNDNNNSPLFFKMIEFNNYEKALKDLSKLAKKEEWCFKNSKDKFLILKIYLQYTFSKLYLDNQICFSKDETLLSFNTGLFTSSMEEIYFIGHLKDKKEKKYCFDSFTTIYSSIDGKKIIQNFNPLPKRATYIKDTSELYFSKDNMIISNYEHILLDNITRIPLKFIFKYTINKKIKEIVKRIEKSNSNTDKLYYALTCEIKKDESTYSNLKFALEKAITLSIKEASENYHLSLASYYPTRDVISLLLPLKLNEKIDCFLLIEKMSSSNYQCQTILTLKQAYTNSRLISSLDYAYLKASEIDD